MKRLLLLFSAVFIFTTSHAQTCGVPAVIVVEGGVTTVSYRADTSGFLAGWDAYAYQWYVNNSLHSSLSSFFEWLPSGFNLVCLKIYGTNPSTGDSCISEHCNVFQSTGDALYPGLQVNVNGLTVDFNGGYVGGYGFNATGSYFFGDGVQSSSGSLFETYTYAAPGSYTVSFYVQEITPSFLITGGQIQRKVNVGNGQNNLELNMPNNSAFCDSIALYTSSSPSYTLGAVGVNLTNLTGVPMNGTGTTWVQTGDVPGHDFLTVSVQAPSQGEDVMPHLVFLDECGVIPDTVQGSVYDDLNFNGLRDAGEPGLAGKEILVSGNVNSDMFASQTASYSATTDANGNYSIIVPHHPVTVHLAQSPGYTLTFPATYYYYVHYNSSTGHPGHNFGLSALSTRLCGTTYLDDNQSGTYNIGTDRSFPGVNIQAHNNITGLDYYTFTGNNGNYCIDLPPGNFTLKPVSYLLDSATVAPDSIVVNSPSGGTFYNNNFGFTSPVPANFDMYLTSLDEPRPGFDITLSARVTNTGYINAVGTVVLNYDPLLTVLATNPAGGVINTTAHTITWTTDTVKPGQQKHFNATMNIPIPTPLGTFLLNSASITVSPGIPENDLTNNTSVRNLTVIGSYDPNDKKVDPAGAHAGGEVHHDTRLNYRIRFQNTGTASAINVIVTDTIDDDLDLTTFMMHRASHPYQLVTNGRIVVWKFLNINLPDSNTNEPASHGFIEYSINPVQGLADGTTIENSANIYFDYNPPVITNSTLNTLQTTIVSTEEIGNGASLMAYPNPTGDKLYLLPRTSNGQLRITLYDITGKKIRTLYEGLHTEGRTITTDLSSLEGGMYLIRMEHAEGNDVVRVVRQ